MAISVRRADLPPRHDSKFIPVNADVVDRLVDYAREIGEWFSPYYSISKFIRDNIRTGLTEAAVKGELHKLYETSCYKNPEIISAVAFSDVQMLIARRESDGEVVSSHFEEGVIQRYWSLIHLRSDGKMVHFAISKLWQQFLLDTLAPLDKVDILHSDVNEVVRRASLYLENTARDLIFQVQTKFNIPTELIDSPEMLKVIRNYAVFNISSVGESVIRLLGRRIFSEVASDLYWGGAKLSVVHEVYNHKPTLSDYNRAVFDAFGIVETDSELCFGIGLNRLKKKHYGLVAMAEERSACFRNRSLR